MRSLINKFPVIAVIALTLGFIYGCEEPLTGEEGEPTFSVELKEFGPGYVDLLVNASHQFEAAYSIGTTERNISNPSILFASGKKITIVPNEPLRISADIQENTEYFLYIAAKLNSEKYSEIYEFKFNSGEFEFSNLLTVVGVDYDGFKMNVSVPASVRQGAAKEDKTGTTAIRYTQGDLMMYNYWKNFGRDDYYHLLYNANDYTTENVVLEYSNETNWRLSDLDINEDGVVDNKDTTIRFNPISPGEPIVFIAGEFEWMEIPEDFPKEESYCVNGFYYPAGWEPGYYLPLLDSLQYWGHTYNTKSMNQIDVNVGSEIDGFWTGAFQKKTFTAKKPDLLEAKVKVEAVDITPVNATVIFTPEEGVAMYAYGIFDDSALNQMIELCDGNEDYLQWAITSVFGAYSFGTGVASGAGEIELDNFFLDVPSNSNIHVLVTAMGNSMATSQNFSRYTFQTKEKTMDAPEVVVTAVEDSTSAFVAAFNIKCTTYDDPTRGPLKEAYYGANYKKDFILEVNKGSSYFALGQSQGFSDAEIKLINSEEGYTIKIPSIDGETTRLVVVGFNEENTPNDVTSYRDILECPAVADCTTPYRDYKPVVKSDLYETLAGDWTATAKLTDGTTHVSKINLSDGIMAGRDYPTALPDSVYTIYKEEADYTEEETEGYFEEFKTNAEIFNKNRVEYQNSLLMSGWMDKDKYDRLTFRSPWELFISREYSGVDVKSMFSDFGPKLYLEVSEGDKLSITGDMYYMPPVAYYSIPYYLAGYCPKRTSAEGNIIFYDKYTTSEYVPLTFDVELSEDGDTLTIKAKVDSDGNIWYPNLVGYDPTQGYIVDALVASEIVLTRGWTESSTNSVTTRSASAPSKLNSAHNVSRFGYKQMTRFGKPVERTKLEGSVMTAEKALERMDNYFKARK